MSAGWIAKRAGLGLEDSEIDGPASLSPADAGPAPREELLVFETRSGRRLAIPLYMVARVERRALVELERLVAPDTALAPPTLLWSSTWTLRSPV
jgi:hypothetical protein